MLRYAAAALTAFGAEFVVVGGCALVLHGLASECGDLDIVPAPDIAALGQLSAALVKLGATHLVGATRMAERSLISTDSPYGRIDVLVARGRVEYQSLRSSATDVPVEGVEVRVAAVRDVLRLRARYRDNERVW